MASTLIVLLAVHFVTEYLTGPPRVDIEAPPFTKALYAQALTAVATLVLMGNVPLLCLVVLLVGRGIADALQSGLAGRSIGLRLGVYCFRIVVLIVAAQLGGDLLDDGFWVRCLGEHLKFYVVTLLMFDAVMANCGMGALVVGVLVKRFGDQVPVELAGTAGAGRVIGMLERSLILFFVVMEQFAGVGFLMTAKSILRIGDIKDASQRALAEYVIIGTFVSFGWGLLTAVLAKYVLAVI